MSEELRARSELCEIGRRLYARGLLAAAEGNLSCRLADGRVLCTPTLICKGFMEPDDLCLVDMEGRPLAGRRRPTSEILLHLEIYAGAPSARAVVHCHPPHAMAFAVTGAEIPARVLPEVEIFLGDVPRTAYETPGTLRFAQSVRPFLSRANTVVLANHGTVSWATTIERAGWQTEILDAYCRVLLLARQIGPVQSLPEDKLAELAALRSALRT
jgi:L-fuculose-phosphate aldolase